MQRRLIILSLIAVLNALPYYSGYKINQENLPPEQKSDSIKITIPPHKKNYNYDYNILGNEDGFLNEKNIIKSNISKNKPATIESSENQNIADGTEDIIGNGSWHHKNIKNPLKNWW
ncbi:hypothetical protein BB561_003098 [Smittium simulii]|uniref:Uncharacterized protein n=1 Tax=Smittium simulii TaxID=133385 RepID=A0A2T9YMX0_9FUNG|nr:hypothetical protein BB561_003098 [Smittium simulii]